MHFVTVALRNQSRRFLRIPKRNLPHLSTFASFHQDIILHIQVVHQWQVRLMNRLIRGWFINPSQLPNSQYGAYSQHWYIHQCCFVVDCILQILFSSYPISLSFNQSLVAKIKKHFNQSTMSLLFYVILFYIIFLPLYLPLSEFVNTGGTI